MDHLALSGVVIGVAAVFVISVGKAKTSTERLRDELNLLLDLMKKGENE